GCVDANPGRRTEDLDNADACLSRLFPSGWALPGVHTFGSGFCETGSHIASGRIPLPSGISFTSQGRGVFMATGKRAKGRREQNQRREHSQVDVSAEQREAKRDAARRKWAKAIRDVGGHAHSKAHELSDTTVRPRGARSTVGTPAAERFAKPE